MQQNNQPYPNYRAASSPQSGQIQRVWRGIQSAWHRFSQFMVYQPEFDLPLQNTHDEAWDDVRWYGYCYKASTYKTTPPIDQLRERFEALYRRSNS
jgi:hypothetical protein